VGVEYRVLGPLEALQDGHQLRLGGPRPRAVLAILLLHAGEVVPATRLIDEVWRDDPPETASNVLQGYVSQLRRELGRDAILTREPGYEIRVERDALDLHRFERLAADGSAALARGQAEEASDALRTGLALWRGPALADVVDSGIATAAASRLDELRLVALERRLEADLACARHSEIVGDIELLVRQHPLRERPRALLMLALYRCGRQAEALAAYRDARTALVDELGIEPGAALQELERAILRQDPQLAVDGPSSPAKLEQAQATILVASLSLDRAGDLVELAAPLAAVGERELIVAAAVGDRAALDHASGVVRGLRERLDRRQVFARAAAFTSITPGADLARMALEQDSSLVLVDAPQGLLEDARLLTLLDDAPCDVAVVVGAGQAEGYVLVPFTGVEHDWAAVELGAWLSRARGTHIRLAGATTGASGRDASRLLANASLAIQRGLGVDAEPLLVEPTPDALVEAAQNAGAVVVGLTDRWRREGLGRSRTALATAGGRPVLLVRRGLRPGGLAPRESDTRFTWTIAPSAGRH
jgi:DNA-binding SARP family transcriptional activator